MTKKRTIAMAGAVIMMGMSVMACGKETAPVGETPLETGTAVAMETMETETAGTKTVSEVKHVPVRKFDTVYTVRSAESEGADATEDAAPEETDAGAEAPEETKAPQAEGTTKDATAQTDTAQEAPTARAETKPAATNPAPAPAAPAAPAHEHTWKEHTATRDEWVPNIVTVPDYETKKVPVRCDIHCNCGAVFVDGDGAREHCMAHLRAGEPDNYWYDEYFEEQTIQVGSHDEDQGYYKDVEYVDYWYCDCGATK